MLQIFSGVVYFTTQRSRAVDVLHGVNVDLSKQCFTLIIISSP